VDDIQGLQGLMEALQGKVGNQTVSPDRLQGHRIRKGADAQIGQSIEGGALVVWIRASLEKAILFHFVELFLRPLAGDPHSLGNLRGGEGFPGERNGAYHLPLGAREIEGFDQFIALLQQTALQAKYCQHDLGQDGRFRVWLNVHKDLFQNSRYSQSEDVSDMAAHIVTTSFHLRKLVVNNYAAMQRHGLSMRHPDADRVAGGGLAA